MDKTIPVRNLVRSWALRDLDLMMAQFSDDAVFENVPMDLIVGKAAIRAANAAFMDLVEAAPWELRNITVTGGGTVMTERLDVFDLKEGRRVAIAVMGAFEVDGQNLITHWRDYFDLADWNRQMRLDPDFGRRAGGVRTG